MLQINAHSLHYYDCLFDKHLIRINTLITTPGRRQSKTSIPSTNADKKSLETEFSIAICRPVGDKWQSKTLFLAIFDPRSSIVKGVFDCCLPGVITVENKVICTVNLMGMNAVAQLWWC